MEKMPDYSKYTLDQLYDVYDHINREKYPDRFKIIVDLIEKRKAEIASKNTDKDKNSQIMNKNQISYLSKTKIQILRCSGVMIAFIVFNMLISTISVLPMLFQSNNNFDPMKVGSFVIYTSIASIAFIFIIPFFDAGIYGLTFLKMNLKEIGFNHFFSLAKNNYVIFLKINIAMGIPYLLFWAIFPRILPIIIS